MSNRRGERILGPYPDRAGWRVVSVDATGKRTSEVLDTEASATRYVEILSAELRHEGHTTATALEEYESHLKAKENKQDSINVTKWAIEQFFPAPVALHLLSAKRCEALYTSLRTRPSTKTGKPLTL